jgi:alkanesulfonate monooxygenase SsuD/methylene tetrahydromethanopterin reductase-like flavin-dependent oxidoreductase (luciferase family)
MEFGMFHEFPTLAERSHADAFDEAMAQIDAAEAWGLDAMWLAELHFAPERSVLAAPLNIAAAIAARTKRIKIGIAVQVLPLCHPLRLAEEAATVDQISRGRLILGVGRSGVVRTYEAYGVPYEESRDRFAEALDIIRQAWTGEPFSHHGQYHDFTDVAVVPTPYQRPAPPIRMAAQTAETFPMIGELGLPVFATARHMTWDELAPLIRGYRASYAAAGHPGRGAVFMSVPTYIADTDDEARADAEHSIMSFYRMQAALLADSLARTAAPAPSRLKRAERLRDLTFEKAMSGHLLVGSPATVTTRLRALGDELGLDGILAELNCGGLIPHARVLNALRLLCQEVMPNFR